MFDVRPQQEASDFSSVQGLAPNLTTISLNKNGHLSASSDQKSYNFKAAKSQPIGIMNQTTFFLKKPTFHNHLNAPIKIYTKINLKTNQTSFR